MRKHFLLKKNNLVCVTFILLLIFVSKAEAISLDNTSYTIDAFGDVNITITCDNIADSIVVYNLTTNSLNEAAYGDYCNTGGPVTFSFPANNFSILEMTTLGICENEVYYYDQCKVQPEFVNEFLFSVVSPGGGGGGGGGSPYISAPSIVYNGAYFTPVCSSGAEFFDIENFLGTTPCGQSISLGDANNVTFKIRPIDINLNYLLPSINVSSVYTLEKKRIISYRPKIQILSPLKNSKFANKVLIDYITTDKNDFGTGDEKANYGLGTKPVSIYYSDNNFDWYPDANMFVNINYKKLIVKDLPGTGQYEWSTKDLIPGSLYRIIVDATDNYDFLGEEVSGYFTVDFTLPIFKVVTDQVMIRSGDVKISVESSEDLQKAPVVLVTQRGGKPTAVNMSLEDGLYVGSYTVQTGYDGSAQISVQGTDLSGNIGTEIESGGTFSIGVNPPPKPNITSSSNKIITSESDTVIKGIVREDTEVILYVNGAMTATIKPDSKGNFTFDKVRLDKTKNQGINRLRLVSRDVLGTISESSNIEIKYNIAPTISLIEPVDKEQLTGTVDLVAKGVDENLDILLYTYEIIPFSKYNSKTLDNNWTIIASGVTGGVYAYDTIESDDGDYMIRVKVSDGNTSAISAPVKVSIKSSAPYFRFENGRKTVTNKSSVIINGKIVLVGNLTNSSNIKTISYSLDEEETWKDIKFNNLYSAEQKFSINIDNLKEGIHKVMWKMTDNNGSVAKGSHIIIVDNTAPKAPIV
ncbi:MAG: hypothetical protein AAB969_02325, partial [Patescibacteria group bacterium]